MSLHLPPPKDPEVRRLKSAVGLAVRWSGPDSPEALAARRALRCAVLAEEIREALVAGLLTAEGRQSLAALLLDGAA